MRIDTPKESHYYRHGGILPFVLRELLGGLSGYRARSASSTRPALSRSVSLPECKTSSGSSGAS